MPALLRAVAENTGTLPQEALADAGFRSEATLAKVADLPCAVIVALGREGCRLLVLLC